MDSKMTNLNTSHKVGDMVELGIGCQWHGFYQIHEIVRVFENGKVAVAVNFKGKRKIFHLAEDIPANGRIAS